MGGGGVGFFFNDTATTEIYTLSLHDALPICPNLGTDVLCSGTVSAAMEGLLEKIPSMALSLADFTNRNFETGAAFARNFLDHYGKTHGTPEARPPMLLNVNIPAIPADQIAGVTMARLTFRQYFRSEEHTSELQSLTNLVCRLLLEKKNNLFFYFF